MKIDSFERFVRTGQKKPSPRKHSIPPLRWEIIAIGLVFIASWVLGFAAWLNWT